MSERYTCLFSLPKNLGLEDCPIVISAGALLKDNATGKVLAQLKLRNLSSQTITSAKVKIHAYGATGAELSGVDVFPYLYLNIPLDGEFGSHTPIPLPDASTHSFSVDILSVTLADGTEYSPTETQAVSGEAILDKVNQLNARRTSKAEAMQRQQQLFRLSFIPLLLAVIAFIFGIYAKYNDYSRMRIVNPFVQAFRVYWGHRFLSSKVPLILALIVPCICILAIWYSKRFPNAPKIAFAVCILCTAIQIFIAIYGMTVGNATWFSLALYIHGGRIYDDFIQLMSAGGYHSPLFSEYLWYFLESLFWVAKNIFAAVILYLQAKNAKK